MKIQERIQKGEQTKAPQGEHRLGAPGDGAIDRRARRASWFKEDGERSAKGLPPKGVIPLRVLPDADDPERHHG